MSRNFAKALFLARQCELYHSQRCPRIRSTTAIFDDLRPLLSSQPRLYQSHARTFTTSQPWRAESAAKKDKSKTQGPLSTQMLKQVEQAKRQGILPEDVGLLPDTFIMPTGKNKPSWTANPRGRLLLERKRLKIRSAEIFAAFMYKFWMVKPRPKLHVGKIPAVAESLHKSMYEHFAAGDLRPLESSVLSGMMGSLRGRIAHRPPGTQLRWKLHKYLSTSRVVSYRAMALPGSKGQKKTERKGLVQAVVRVHSLQSLQHVRKVSGRNKKEILVDAQGRELSGADVSDEAATKHAKELVEYVVVQKSLKNSKEGPWKLWGTTEETRLDMVEQKQRKGKRTADAAIA